MRMRRFLYLALITVQVTVSSPAFAENFRADELLRQGLLQHDWPLVERSLCEGADGEIIRSQTGKPAMVWLVTKRLKNGVIALLERGVSPNAPTFGNGTPLMWAAAMHDKILVELLIRHGAELDAKDRNGATALMWAAGGGNEEAVRILLEAGADYRIRGYMGRSALDWAVYNHHGKASWLLRRARLRRPLKGINAFPLT